MSTRRSGPGKTFLFGFTLAVAAATVILLPCSTAAQAVSGIISGNVADPQGQVIPGATLTIVSEATNDARVTVSDGNGGFQVTNLQPGSYTVRVEMPSFRTLERKNVVLSAGERLSVGTLTLDIGSLGETVVVEARGTQVNVAETQHSGRHHLQADRAGAGARPRRDVDHAAAAGRSLREHRRLARHELWHAVPNVGGARRDWSNVIVDGVVSNEVGNSGPDGAANQPRRDCRGQGPAQLVSCRVRTRRRRPGADRQQERHVELPRQSLLLRPQRGAQRHRLLRQPRERRRSRATASIPTAPTSAARYRSWTRKLFFFYSLEAPLVSRPGTATQLDDADSIGDAGRLLSDAR